MLCGLSMAAGVGLAACLHDTDISLKNTAPTISEAVIIKDLSFPDSLVGVFSVRDSNEDEARIVPATWPGHQYWSEKGDSVTLFMNGPQLGTFAGKLALMDRRGAVDSVPFKVSRILRGFFPDSAGLIAWQNYQVLNTERFAWFDESGEKKYGFELHYNPDTGGKDYVDGLAGAFGVSGDFRLRVYEQIDSAPIQNIRMDFFMSPLADTDFHASESLGFSISNDTSGGANGSGYGFGKNGATTGVAPLTTYAAEIERIGTWYRVLGADSAAAEKGEWDTLLAIDNSNAQAIRQTLHPHFRFAVLGGRTHVYGDFYGLVIDKGMLRP